MNKPWIVGVSAGPDSMALVEMLRSTKKELVLVHVNYHQRESANRDQHICEAYAHKHDIECVVFDAPESYEGNFQAFARDFRMKAFLETVKQYNGQGIYLAHHQDDQLESIVFNLLTKRTPQHLGMKRKQNYGGSTLLRPLLSKSKQELIEYCHQNDIEYGIDESNESLVYKRNQIRYVLKDMSHLDKRCLLAYQQVYNQRQKSLNCSLVVEDQLDLKKYRHWSLERRLRVLRAFLQHHQIEVYSMSRAYFKSLDERLLNPRTQTIIFDESHQMVIQYDKAVITSSKNYDFSVKFDKIYYTTHEFFSTKKSGPSTSGVSLSPSDFPIVIRNARHGDKIAMRYGTKKVSRFFIDRKIKMEERRVWPVVENAQGEVILVVGLGCDKYHYSQQPNLFVVK